MDGWGSGRHSEQGQVPAAADSVRAGVGDGPQGIEQAPSHGSNLVEALQGSLRPGSIDGAGGGEQAQVAVDLLG